MRILTRHRAAPALVAAMLLTLSACNTKPTELTSDDTDDQKEAVAHAKPVELPPAIQASKSYRCKDNTVAYVDWFAGDKQAAIRAKKDDSPVMAKADAPGIEKVADGGYAVSGDAKAATIDITLPGKGKQTCKG